MKVSRPFFLFTVYSVLLVGQAASPVTTKVPDVSEVDLSNQFRCQLDYGSNPKALTFGRQVGRVNRKITVHKKQPVSESFAVAECEVVNDSIYRCDWSSSSFLELPLNSAQWVYISSKKFNYILTGRLQTGGLRATEKVIRCSFVVEL